MTGITLDRSEFIVLMDAVEAEEVVGLNTDSLVPADDAQLKSTLEKGIKLLEERGALRVVDDVNIMNVDLLSMAVLVANPEVAVITTRDNPGLGEQLFLHYCAGDVIVEQTLPTTEQHRWALVPGQAGLVDRLLGILPVQDAPAGAPAAVTLSQADLLEVKRLIESRQSAQARPILSKAGLTGDTAENFIAAIAQPKFGGQMALLQCRHREITDGRNVAVVQGEKAAFMIKPSTENPEVFEVSTADESKVRSLLVNWFAELSARQN